MLSTDKNCLKFFNEKGNDIVNYITEILPSDYIKAFDNILQTPQSNDTYAKVIKIFNEHPEFKQELAENINNPNALKRFNKLSSEK